jgi:hypothetical protein
LFSCLGPSVGVRATLYAGPACSTARTSYIWLYRTVLDRARLRTAPGCPRLHRMATKCSLRPCCSSRGQCPGSPANTGAMQEVAPVMQLTEGSALSRGWFGFGSHTERVRGKAIQSLWRYRHPAIKCRSELLRRCCTDPKASRSSRLMQKCSRLRLAELQLANYRPSEW